MFQSEIKLRVRYGETDQMGYVYYGRYAEYFEVARVETLRELGLSYKEMEDEGIMLPVLEYNIKYVAPARYDEELTIKTKITEMPSARIHFEYEVVNPEGKTTSLASTTLVFIDKESGRPTKPPQELIELLQPFY